MKLSCIWQMAHFYRQFVSFQKAVTISQRPFLHFTTIPVLIMLLMIPAYQWLRSFRWNLWLCTIACAFLSHHTRDATRRGFTFWPLGMTKSLPYPLYIGCIIVIPFALAKWLCVTSPNQLRHDSTADILTI